MKIITLQAVATLLMVSGSLAVGAQPERTELITDIADTISANYVFPDTGEEIADTLMTNLATGAYDDLNIDELAQMLETQILDLSHDLHFRVRPLPQDWTPPVEEENENEDEGESEEERQGPPSPHGFNTIQRLDGNIGYIDLRGFAPALYIEDTVKASMQLLQGSSSIIFDLRKNGGGDPAAVQLISSYLFDPSEPVHLNSLYFRPDDTTTEFWTHDGIETSLAMPDVPVYVLTSSRTFSAAEEFTYNLKNLKRATIIGETTGGGAHPVNSMIIGNQLMVVLPIARAISPITGTNWEGTGVSPDLKVPAKNALDSALLHALGEAVRQGDDSVRWGLANIKARKNPITLSSDDLKEYAGTYGPRHVRIGHDGLEYRREGVSDWQRLICFKADEFLIEGHDDFIMVFDRDEKGLILGIAGHSQRGYVDFSPRDE